MVQQSMRDGWRQADPPERPVLFVNPKSGGGTAVRTSLADRARERGIEVTVLAADQRLAALVDEAVARGADALGMAGGDGSLAVVAAAAHAHDLPFVCIPAGTRNHFALDLGVDVKDPVGRAGRVHRRGRARDRHGARERPPLPQQRLAGHLRRSGSPTGVSRRQGAYALGHRRARCSGQAQRHPTSSSWTTSDTSIAGRLSSSCRTIPMRSTVRRRTAGGQGSTAVDSVSSSLVGRLQLTELASVDRDVARGAWAGTGARGSRRRGGRPERATRVRGRACCAAREDLGSAVAFATAARTGGASANAQARDVPR